MGKKKKKEEDQKQKKQKTSDSDDEKQEEATTAKRRKVNEEKTEEERRQMNQAAAFKILRAINTARGSDSKSSFQDARVALGQMLEQEMKNTGELGAELQEDAEKVVRERAKHLDVKLPADPFSTAEEKAEKEK